MLLSLLVGARPVLGIGKTFTGAVSTDWFTAANWMPAGVPTAGDDIAITTGHTTSLSSDATAQSLTLSGTLTGAGNLTVTAMITWTSGTMGGSGVTNANGGILINGGSSKRLDRTLNNGGAAVWTDLGVLSVSGTLNNLSGATFTIQNDRTITGLGATALFNNAGVVVKMNSVQRTTIDIALNNMGTLRILSGTLEVAGGGTHSGRFEALLGRLDFGGGTHHLTVASIVTGTDIVFSAGSVGVAGFYQTSSSTTCSGASVTFTGMVPGTGALNVVGGTVSLDNVEGTLDVPTLMLAAGTISGASNLNVRGVLSWSGGTMSGIGVTNANGGLLLSGTAARRLDRTLNHSGNGAWSGSGPFALSGHFNNLPGATFEVQNDSAILGSGMGRITNAGTFRKTTGLLSTYNALLFENLGVVEILSGVLTIGSSYTQSTGVTRLLLGTVLRSPNPVQIDGGRLEGNGTMDAPLANSGVVAPGLSPGRLLGTHPFTQGASGVLEIEIGGTAPAAHDQLDVTAAALLNGGLRVHMLAGYTPQSGDEIPILTFTEASGDFISTSGLVTGVGQGFSKIVRDTAVVLKYGIETCDDTLDNDADGLADCADAKCAAFVRCASLPTPTPTATAAPRTATPCSPCSGDCDCDGLVSSNELVAGIDGALANPPTIPCTGYDRDDNGSVDVDDLVIAVDHAVDGCPP